MNEIHHIEFEMEKLKMSGRNWFSIGNVRDHKLLGWHLLTYKKDINLHMLSLGVKNRVMGNNNNTLVVIYGMSFTRVPIWPQVITLFTIWDFWILIQQF